MPAHQTYQIRAPLETHWRVATCTETGCDAHEYGWRTVVDERTDIGTGQAGYIRSASGRSYTEERTEAGLTTFTFGPGQTCFREHRIPLQRPATMRILTGPRPGIVERAAAYRPDDWVDHFATHLDRIDQIRQHG
jgi:hypothetical protein